MLPSLIRPWISAAALLVTLTGSVAAAGPATAGPTATSPAAASLVAAAEPEPVIGKAVFNNPLGTTAEQNAIFIQLARIIDRVPAGAEIQLSWFHFTFPDGTDSPTAPDIAGRLIAAHERGVDVKAILDRSQTASRPYQRLRTVLGGVDTAGSYVVHCADQFPTQQRACIGTRSISYSNSTVYAYNHNKFLTASRIVRDDGSSVANVVFQASSNLTWWDANEAYNNALTFSDPVTYQAYRQYFTDLRAHRYDSNGDNNYYWATPTGSTYKAHFFPRQERTGQPVSDPATDTVANILDTVSGCHYDNNGVRRQTDVRVMMFAFNRAEVAKRLTSLRNAGCWVDVVVTQINDAVLAALGSNVQLTRCNFNVGPGLDVRVHHKYMLIDGAYDDDIVPRVFTGSHNYAVSALRQADETLLRVMGRATHDEYLSNFWHIRDTCRARGGIIR